MSKGWYFHHRMKWTIVIKDYKWFTDNELDIFRWLESEGILVHNTLKNRIFLYSEDRATYFKLRWG